MNKKLVGFTADGASIMQGCKAGLARLLKNDWPHLIARHCLAHRLELGFKDAVKKVTKVAYDKAMTLLMGLFYMYHKSPKQKKALYRAFDMLQIKPILPTRIGGTRWLPHLQRSIDAFLKGYTALYLQLQNSSHENPKAEGLAKLATNGHVIVFILSIKMTVSILMRLSLYLQKRELSLADAFTRMYTIIDILKNINTKDNDDISAVLNTGMFKTVTLSFKVQKPKPVNEALITNLIEALQNRFPHDHSPVIEVSLISGLHNWPYPGSDSILDHGVDDVTTLHAHFGGVLEVELVVLLEEWSLLKNLLFKKYSSRLQKGDLTWEEIFIALREQDINNIFSLLELLRNLPSTSVRNETTFSAMKLIKNKRHGRMGSERLNDLLLIHLESASNEEFNHDEAIKEWMITPSGRSRRVEYHRTKAETVSVTVAEPSAVTVPDDVQIEEPMLIAEKVFDPDWDTDDTDDEVSECGDAEMSEELVYGMLNNFMRE